MHTAAHAELAFARLAYSSKSQTQAAPLNARKPLPFSEEQYLLEPVQLN